MPAKVTTVDLQPAYAAQQNSLRRTRDAIRRAEDTITATLRMAPTPATIVVRKVAVDLALPRSTVKLALLSLMHRGAVHLGEGYEVTLADR